ncbi:kinase-like domain-containing protein [Melampsora americana]|nr:kinase-like domain-containing protein [Melampsora americana]
MRSVDEDQIVLDEWIEIFDPKAEKPSGSVKVRIQLGLTPPKQRASKVELQHFDVIKLIGEGSYGQVFRVRKKDTKRVYAMKVLNKQKILKDGKQTLEHVLAERQILIKTRSSPFLVGLKFSFQSSDDLHLIMDLKSGGELMSYMQRYGGRFPEPWVVFYTAEILSGLSFLHSMDIIYRDLKPENCLLDATGHVALCDFGLSKMEMTSNSSTRTFCGTTEYIAPEILMENGYTRAVDFWALGVLIFEMTVGWTPFFSEDRVTKYSLILESDISAKIPKRGVEEMTRDIILQLLERDPKKRLGSETGSEEIKTHEFFKTIEWTKLINRRLRPPFRPRVESDADVMEKRVYGLSSMNFNPSRRSSVDNSIGLNPNEVFRNFTFSRQTSTSSLMRLENEEVNERLNRSIGRRSSSEDELDGYED